MEGEEWGGVGFGCCTEWVFWAVWSRFLGTVFVELFLGRAEEVIGFLGFSFLLSE